MGLGCGGHSRLGMSAGKSESNAIQIVQKSLELGVNFIDTAESYGTEGVVGKALPASQRSSVSISTKLSASQNDRLSTASAFKARVEGSLKRLNSDYIDILHIHGVSLEEYPYVVSELVPALLALRDEGKIRFLGITEAFIHDTTHKMLTLALQDDCWDVMMVGFNLLNQSARERVFLQTQAKKIGILCMFAVRRALSSPEVLKELMRDLVAQGLVDRAEYNPDSPLDFLLESGCANSVPEAAYRVCRYEPGIHTVLSGTGDLAHLEENSTSLMAPPLPDTVIAKLKRLFRLVNTVSGN